MKTRTSKYYLLKINQTFLLNFPQVRRLSLSPFSSSPSLVINVQDEHERVRGSAFHFQILLTSSHFLDCYTDGHVASRVGGNASNRYFGFQVDQVPFSQILFANANLQATFTNLVAVISSTHLRFPVNVTYKFSNVMGFKRASLSCYLFFLNNIQTPDLIW